MTDNKQVTELTKAVRKALKAEHRIEVPHSALRASLLQALGENPHALAKQQTSPQGEVTPAAAPASANRAARKQPWVQVRLHVQTGAANEAEGLSFDGDGVHLIKKSMKESGAVVIRIETAAREAEYTENALFAREVARAKEHGLLVSPALEVVCDCEFESLDVLMPQAAFTDLAFDAMEQSDEEDEVAYYVAEQYQLMWHQESRASQAGWFLRYLGESDSYKGPTEVTEQEVVQAQPLPEPEALPAGLKHVKALTFQAFEEAYRRRGLHDAFEVATVNRDGQAILYWDKAAGALSQQAWFEYLPGRGTVSYVLRVVDCSTGETLCETECELSMAKAAGLLEESIEQQLGLQALRREEQRRWREERH